MPQKENKGKKRKNETGPRAAQLRPAVRRTPRWYHVVFPFLVILFAFGGTDALLMKNPFATVNALFLVAVIFWNVFFPLRRRTTELILGASALCAYFAVILFALPAPRLSRETTYLLEPTNRNGKSIDYFEAIRRQNAPARPVTENGYRDYVAALGPDAILSPSVLPRRSNDRETFGTYRRLLCEALQLDPRLDFRRDAAVPPYIDAESYFFAKLRRPDSPRSDFEASSGESVAATDKTTDGTARQLWDRVAKAPWRAEDFPLAAQWLRDHRRVPDVLCDALRKAEFHIPMLRREETQPLKDLPHLGDSVLPAGRDLGILVQRDIGDGRMENARELNALQFRLAESLFRQSVGYQGIFTASRIWDGGVDAMIALLHHGYENGPLEDMEQYVAQREKFLDPFPEDAMRRIIRQERLAALDRIQSLAWGRTGWRGGVEREGEPADETEYPFLLRKLLRMFYWNGTMQNMNRYFDWIEKSESSAESVASLLPVRANETEIESILRTGVFRAIPDRLGYREIQARIDSNRAYEREILRLRTRAALVKTAFYLEKYRLEHDGLYPPYWLTLREEYGEEIPCDPAQPPHPLLYQALFGNRGYLLYSIGPNGRDEGGASALDSKDCDDVAIRKDVPEFKR